MKYNVYLKEKELRHIYIYLQIEDISKWIQIISSAFDILSSFHNVQKKNATIDNLKKEYYIVSNRKPEKY